MVTSRIPSASDRNFHCYSTGIARCETWPWWIALRLVFDEVSKFPKQEALLLAYLDMSRKNEEEEMYHPVKKSLLLKRAGANATSLDSMVKKNIFEIYEKEVGRLSNFENENKII